MKSGVVDHDVADWLVSTFAVVQRYFRSWKDKPTLRRHRRSGVDDPQRHWPVSFAVMHNAVFPIAVW